VKSPFQMIEMKNPKRNEYDFSPQCSFLRIGKMSSAHNMIVLSILFISIILIFLPSPANAIRCYQCYSNSFEPCPYEDLKECPPWSFYNRCSTKVRKLFTGEVFVKRECSLGCHDGSDAFDGETRMSLHCDTRRPEWECKVCCRGEGCNWSGATSITPFSLSAIMALSLLSLLAFLIQ